MFGVVLTWELEVLAILTGDGGATENFKRGCEKFYPDLREDAKSFEHDFHIWSLVVIGR